jgi:hypothetical protein
MAAKDKRYRCLFEEKFQEGEIASVPHHGACPEEALRRGDYVEVELYSGGDVLGFLGLRVRDRIGLQHGGPAYEIDLMGASTPQAMAYADNMLKCLVVTSFVIHVCEAHPNCRFKMGGEWVLHTDEVRQRFERWSRYTSSPATPLKLSATLHHRLRHGIRRLIELPLLQKQWVVPRQPRMRALPWSR